MRLAKLKKKTGDVFDIQWKPFALRPEPDPSAAFQGTYREDAWKRVAELLSQEGIQVKIWERSDFPDCSLPALQAGLCASRQGSEAWADLHLRLYEAFFVRGINIGRKEEVIEVAREAALDFTRFLTDYNSDGLDAETIKACARTIEEYQVRAVPTVIFPSGKLVGAYPEDQYRQALERSGVKL